MTKSFKNIFNLPVKVIDHTKNWNFGAFSEFRNELFGIAILGVLLAHGLSLYISIPNVWTQKLLSASSSLVFTQGFLFLSGMGLWFAYNKGITLKKFYSKRVSRLFIPWAVIAIPLFFILNVCFSHDITKFLINCSTLTFWQSANNGTWYFSIIIVLYVIFPILFKIFKKKGATAFITINFLYLLFLFSLQHLNVALFNRLAIGLNQVPAFFAGVYLGQKVWEGSKPQPWHYLMVFTILFTLKFLQGYDKIFAEYSIIAQRLVTTALLCIPLKCIKGSIISKFLSFCGSISLELYLSHILLIPIFKHIHTHNAHIFSTFPTFHGFTEYAFIISLSFGICILYKHFFRRMPASTIQLKIAD